MSDDDKQKKLEELRAKSIEQGEVVRKLKTDKADKQAITEAVAELKARKKAVDALEKELAPKPEGSKYNREGLEELCKRRFFWSASFSIYGGVAGLYDYGPVGCAIKCNVLNLWRQHFVIAESMLELDCSVITPSPVLAASGHEERFCDLMVKDAKSNDYYRADHLLEDSLKELIEHKKTTPEQRKEYELVRAKADTYSKAELKELLIKYKCKAVVEGVAREIVPDPIDFNLMFATSIGPSGVHRGYLRPETAQSIFVNFKKLLEYNNNHMPFAAAQIGQAFRNEISPKQGLLRVREFTMAEIEYFHKDTEKEHPRFADVADVMLPLLSADAQMRGEPVKFVRLGDAVAQGVIANQSIGYFIGRIFLFLKAVGLDCGDGTPGDVGAVRFRQHMETEMAHYARDCWDAEAATSYGWVEIVGCADRSAYDLDAHSRAAKLPLQAQEPLDEPRVEREIQVLPNKGPMGKALRKAMQPVCIHLEALGQEEKRAMMETLASAGNVAVEVEGVTHELGADLLSIKEVETKVHVENYTPSVIEPSFGIGRIIYALMEHRYWVRKEDEARSVVSLAPAIAPVKAAVLPLSRNERFAPFLSKLDRQLIAAGISHNVDDAGSVGKRYARADEIAVPFAITVDFQSLEDDSVTLRERDSTKQIRARTDEVVNLIAQLCEGTLKWEEARKLFPEFTEQQLAESESAAAK